MNSRNPLTKVEFFVNKLLETVEQNLSLFNEEQLQQLESLAATELFDRELSIYDLEDETTDDDQDDETI